MLSADTMQRQMQTTKNSAAPRVLASVSPDTLHRSLLSALSHLISQAGHAAHASPGAAAARRGDAGRSTPCPVFRGFIGPLHRQARRRRSLLRGALPHLFPPDADCGVPGDIAAIGMLLC